MSQWEKITVAVTYACAPFSHSLASKFSDTVWNTENIYPDKVNTSVIQYEKKFHPHQSFKLKPSCCLHDGVQTTVVRMFSKRQWKLMLTKQYWYMGDSTNQSLCLFTYLCICLTTVYLTLHIRCRLLTSRAYHSSGNEGDRLNNNHKKQMHEELYMKVKVP